MLSVHLGKIKPVGLPPLSVFYKSDGLIKNGKICL